MIKFIAFIIFGIIGADAGGSAWWSNIWGEKGDGKGGMMPFNMTWFPEFLLALSVGVISTICIGSHFRGRPKYWRYNPHFASEFFAYALCVGGAILLWV